MKYFTNDWYKVDKGYVTVDITKTSFLFTNKEPKKIKESRMITSSVDYLNNNTEIIFKMIRPKDEFIEYIETYSEYIKCEEDDIYRDIIFEIKKDKCWLRSIKGYEYYTEFKNYIQFLEDDRCKFDSGIILDALEDLDCKNLEISLNRETDICLSLKPSIVLKLRNIDSNDFVVILPKVTED